MGAAVGRADARQSRVSTICWRCMPMGTPRPSSRKAHDCVRAGSHHPVAARDCGRGADDLRARHQPPAHHYGATAADRSYDRTRRDRPRVSVLLSAGRGARHRQDRRACGERREGRCRRSARSVAQACGAFRADGRAGHRADGDGRTRRRGVGRPGDRRRLAVGAPVRRAAEADPRLQQLRPWPDGRPGSGGGRSGETAGARISRHQAAAGLSDRAAGSGGAARGAQARRRRRQDHGRLQSGAQRRRGAASRPRARRREPLSGSRSRSATTTMPATPR